MSRNLFGTVLRMTTWGESHGEAIGCVLDGVPPMLELSESDIQPFLDKRRPGQSRFTTQRQEPDTVKILSGVFEGKTTGTPISLMIVNQDQRSKDYGEIKSAYRPGHADFTYMEKYGIRDYRGGGRSSARETAMRVAAGAVARKILGNSITIRAALVQIGKHKVDMTRWDWNQVEQNPFFCPDEQMVSLWSEYVSVIVMDYSALFWATLYGWLLFDMLPPASTWLGAPIIIAAGIVIAWREHRLSRPTLRYVARAEGT
jgi:chorismate synthase